MEEPILVKSFANALLVSIVFWYLFDKYECLKALTEIRLLSVHDRWDWDGSNVNI